MSTLRISRSLPRLVPKHAGARLCRGDFGAALRSQRLLQCPHRSTFQRRPFASQTAVDAKVEELQELYANARDEFEIAAEETEKMTVYAEDDRAAAKAEMEKLQKSYSEVVDGSDSQLAKEVMKRVGHRIRELGNAMQAMEEMAQNQD